MAKVGEDGRQSLSTISREVFASVRDSKQKFEDSTTVDSLRFGRGWAVAILLPYCVELRLKFMIATENGGEFEATHDLVYLFDALSPACKTGITENQGSIDVREVLVEHRNTHRDLRYPPEQGVNMKPTQLEQVWYLLDRVASTMPRPNTPE